VEAHAGVMVAEVGEEGGDELGRDVLRARGRGREGAERGDGGAGGLLDVVEGVLQAALEGADEVVDEVRHGGRGDVGDDRGDELEELEADLLRGLDDRDAADSGCHGGDERRQEGRHIGDLADGVRQDLYAKGPALFHVVAQQGHHGVQQGPAEEGLEKRGGCLGRDMVSLKQLLLQVLQRLATSGPVRVGQAVDETLYRGLVLLQVLSADTAAWTRWQHRAN
jgi:hypothetical protein